MLIMFRQKLNKITSKENSEKKKKKENSGPGELTWIKQSKVPR